MVIPNETEREHRNEYLRLVLMVTANYKAREKEHSLKDRCLVIPQPVTLGRMSGFFLDTWNWILLQIILKGKKKISVNLSHPIQSYFLKPKLKQTSKLKLSLPDISTWSLFCAISSRELSVHWGGGTLSKEARAHLHFFLFFPSPKSPSLDGSCWEQYRPPTTRRDLHPTLFFLVLFNIFVSGTFLLLLFRSQFLFASSLITWCPVHCEDVPVDHRPSPSPAPGSALGALAHCSTAFFWQSIYAHTPFPAAWDPRSSKWLFSPQTVGKGQRSRRGGIQETRALV